MTVALAGLAALVVITALVFHPHPRGDGGGDDFNDCISKVVPQDSSHENGFIVEVSNRLLAVITGSGAAQTGDAGAALKIGINGADREAYRLLSEGASRSIIDGCIQHFNRSSVPTVNAELQVWTRIDGQPVDGVVVTRRNHPGDVCTTRDGSCLLTLHNVTVGQSEGFIASYNNITSPPSEVPAEAIAKGAVDIDLTPTSFRHIIVMNGTTPLKGAYVTVVDATGSKSARNADCIRSHQFGRSALVDCTRSDTGGDGEGANFVFARDVEHLATLQVQVDYDGQEHLCVASARGNDFVVSWPQCLSAQAQPKAALCSDKTVRAVRAVLSSAEGRTTMSAAHTTVHFEIQGHAITRVEARPDSDLSQLAIKTLRAAPSIDPQGSPHAGRCIGQLSWTSH